MKTNEGDTKSTASMTHATNVSTITDQVIKEAIAAETAKMQSESVKAAAVIEARFQKIDDSLQLLASQLVRDIFTQLTGSNSPFVTSSQLDQKLDRLSQQIEQLTNGTSSSNRSVGSPHRKQARTNGPPVNSGEENPMEVENEFHNCS
jgi:DNA repair exonuclease SbcCD ATPase subunit